VDTQTTAYVKAQINFELQRFKERGKPPGGFEKPPDIPAGRYINNEFFCLEQEHIWSKSWLLAAHTDQLPEVGSYQLWERGGGVPVLIVRGRDNKIRAFYNTCMHRGGSLVRQTSGTEKAFMCQYHCWVFGLDGVLNHIPDEHEFGGIDKSQRHLKPMRCECLGNLIFINRDLDAIPLEQFLGPMVEQLRDFEPDQLKFVTQYTFDLPVNWKIMIDAFQEVYHLKHIHPQTVDQMLDHRGASMALFPQGHSRMMVPAKTGQDQFVSIPAQNPLEADNAYEMARSGSLSFSLFPNIITPISAVSFPFLLFWPVTRNRTLFEVIFYSRGDNTDPESPEWQQQIAGFNVILQEDNENLPWIQRSMESGALQGVPLSYQERRIYHFHEYVDQMIDPDRIPAKFRVIPRLKNLEEDGTGNRNVS
jgi:phenylpropionate dioxygenase-like ring-hydroxylating dioxygenase large terminal subunit